MILLLRGKTLTTVGGTQGKCMLVKAVVRQFGCLPLCSCIAIISRIFH